MVVSESLRSFEGNNDQSVNVRRSNRESRVPQKFTDYIIDGKYKYGIEKSINYFVLSVEINYFVTSLNKSMEPQSYHEASLNPNWVQAIYEEMEALYRNQN